MHHLRHEKMYGDIKLYAGTASPELTAKVAEYLGVSVVRPGCGRLSRMTTCLSNCTAACAGRIAM